MNRLPSSASACARTFSSSGAATAALSFLPRYVQLFNSSKALQSILPRSLDSPQGEAFLSRIQHLCGLSGQAAIHNDSLQQGLLNPTYDLLDRGGKRWRPVLGMVMAEVLSSFCPARASLRLEQVEKNFDIFQICAACEILHNASLIVDDIEDRSLARRGAPCTYLKFGTDIAINAGNFLYFFPFTMRLLASSASPQQELEFRKTVQQECMKLHLGQNWDIMWHQKDNAYLPTTEQYLLMISNKTAILPRLLTRLLSIAIPVAPEISSKLTGFAEQVGLAFQIKDDLLNIQENPLSQSKQKIGEDITEGKKTLIIIETAKQLEDRPALRDKFLATVGSHTENQQEIAWAIGVMKETGGVDAARLMAEKQVRNAWEGVRGLGQAAGEGEGEGEGEAEGALSRLRGIGEYLIERNL